MTQRTSVSGLCALLALVGVPACASDDDKAAQTPEVAADGLVSPPAGAINVQSFGATGDGSTNDAAAINRAVASAGSGATIYFPPGRYAIDGASIDLKSGLTYLGDPGGGTTIAGSWAMANGNASDGPHDVTVEQITFDGNGLLFYNVVVPNNITIVNNTFKNGSASYVGGDQGCGGVTGTSTAIMSTIGFSNSRIANNLFQNLYMAPPNNDPTGANWNCEGMSILVQNRGDNLTIDANRFDQVQQAIGVYLGETYDPNPRPPTIFTNNYITGAVRMGIEIQGHAGVSPMTMAGNYIAMYLNSNGTGVGNEIGISIAVGGTGHQILNNTVLTAPPLSGAAMELMGDGFLSQGNYIAGWANAQLIGCTDQDCSPNGWDGQSTWVSKDNTFCDFVNDYNLEFGGHVPATDQNTDQLANCNGLPAPTPPAAGPGTGSGGGGGGGGGGSIGPGTYHVRPHASSGASLDVTGASTGDGAAVELWQVNGGANQNWQVVAVSGGFHLFGQQSGKCLDLDSATPGDGVHLQQQDCSSSSTQTFTFPPIGSGQVTIKNAASGRCIDTGGSVGNGTLPEEWDCVTAYTNQYWDITGA